MRHQIQYYEGIMIAKILACKSTLTVLNVIDRKIDLIRRKTIDRSLINQFLDNSLINLRNTNNADIEPDQFSKIRSAIDHLENLRMQYKVF